MLHRIILWMTSWSQWNRMIFNGALQSVRLCGRRQINVIRHQIYHLEMMWKRKGSWPATSHPYDSVSKKANGIYITCGLVMCSWYLITWETSLGPVTGRFCHLKVGFWSCICKHMAFTIGGAICWWTQSKERPLAMWTYLSCSPNRTTIVSLEWI